MGACCKNRFPCPHSLQNAASYRTRRIHESCEGTSCSRSYTPAKPRPPLWESRSSPFTPRQNSLFRPQSAPTNNSLSASFHEQPSLQDRPASAQSKRSTISYESCQYSSCSRSPVSTPRKLEDPVNPWEPKRPITPEGWTYAPKRRNRRGTWWDKDWKAADRSNHFRDPNLQDCGCYFSKVHSGSRTPSPLRSSRAIGLEYHLNRRAKESQARADGKGGANLRPRTQDDRGRAKFQDWGHRHKYHDWSCSSSKSQSRSTTPRATPRAIPKATPNGRIRSRWPSPGRSTGSATARERPPLKQRPPTPGAQQTPYMTPHGHCHTYHSWSCTPSKSNTPRGPTPTISRSPTPPREPSPEATTTIKVSYAPTPPETGIRSRGSCSCTEDQNALDANAAPPRARLFESRPCQHCSYFHPTCRICPTCGHSHGHHGQTTFTLAPSSTGSTVTDPWAAYRGPHHCHGQHHHGCHHRPCQCFHPCHHH